MNPQQIRLVSLWVDAGQPGSFEKWNANYQELLRLYRENGVALQLGADAVEIGFYESEIGKLERLVYPSVEAV